MSAIRGPLGPCCGMKGVVGLTAMVRSQSARLMSSASAFRLGDAAERNRLAQFRNRHIGIEATLGETGPQHRRVDLQEHAISRLVR